MVIFRNHAHVFGRFSWTRGHVTAQDWYTVQGRSEVGPDGMGKKVQLPGWWFGTWLLFFHMLGIIIPTDFHIFQRGSNHQPVTPSHFLQECASDTHMDGQAVHSLREIQWQPCSVRSHGSTLVVRSVLMASFACHCLQFARYMRGPHNSALEGWQKEKSAGKTQFSWFQHWKRMGEMVFARLCDFM